MVVLRTYRETIWRRGWIWAAAVGVVILLVALVWPPSTVVPWYQRLPLHVGSPVVRLFHRLQRTASGWFGGARHEELARLQRALVEAQVTVGTLTEAAQERDRLRALLQLRSTYPEGIAAQVIGHDPRAEFQSLLVDRGSADGVTTAMVAVAHGGVVGHVGRTAPHESTILLLIDPNHAMDVWVQRSRVRGLLVGTGDRTSLHHLEGITRLEYLGENPDILPGDLVVTTGLDHRYPKGLPVGTVESVQRGAAGLYATATVVPLVDWGSVEEILLLPGDS